MTTYGLTSVVVVGEVNPLGADPRLALYHLPRRSSGDRFRVIAGLSDADYLRFLARRNLCFGRWESREACAAAAGLVGEPFSTYILLGRRVAAAFGGLALVCRVDGFGSYTVPGGKVFCCLPHPSGLCRAWNEPGSVERARDLLRAHAPGISWGSS